MSMRLPPQQLFITNYVRWCVSSFQHYHVSDVSDWWRWCYILLACSGLSLNYDDMSRSGRD